MLFYNYGLFWKRVRVHWSGEKGNAGHLKGYESGKKKAIVDFREQRGIYFLYDDAFQLVYVGQAGSGNNRLFSRLKSHTNNQLADRWEYFSWFGTRKVKKDHKLSNDRQTANTEIKKVLNHVEGVLIEAIQPHLNKQGGRFSNSTLYCQYVDDDNVWFGKMDALTDMYREIQILQDKVDALSNK